MQQPVGSFLTQLRRILPPTWKIDASLAAPRGRDRRADAVITIESPDGFKAKLFGVTKTRMSAREAADLTSVIQQVLSEGPWDGAILFTEFVSQMARERLRSAGISYLDSTGNAWISLSRPAVFVERQGAKTDPDPPQQGVRSLKGPKAARIVRALCDWRPPSGVRELAKRAITDPGYTTRVLSLLENEDVIQRDDRGIVVNVRWQELLRRWSSDYQVWETNRALPYLAPRGLSTLRERLSVFNDRYAVTGQFAVPPQAQVVPGALFSCYVPSAEVAATELDLRATDAGANVLLLEPFDELVFKRTRVMDGLITVAMTQCVVDLMTGTGREPAQADALMSWMAENEDAWRA